MDVTSASAFFIGTLMASAALFLYCAARESIRSRRLDSGARGRRAGGVAGPLAGGGIAAALIAVWLETPGPIPGDYNLVFADVYYLFGIGLFALALALTGFQRGEARRRPVPVAISSP